MSSERAKQLGVKPLAKILGFADAALDPIDFTIAPTQAIPKALSMAKVDAKKVDFYEINQAFSVVSLANIKVSSFVFFVFFFANFSLFNCSPLFLQLLNLDPSRVDVNGGSVSLGHPIGCSGARIIVTLLHTLKQRNGKIGVAGICNGGGGASAIVIENLS
jgi:acetyl-CoA C-acetyltransferase